MRCYGCEAPIGTEAILRLEDPVYDAVMTYLEEHHKTRLAICRRCWPAVREVLKSVTGPADLWISKGNGHASSE